MSRCVAPTARTNADISLRLQVTLTIMTFIMTMPTDDHGWRLTIMTQEKTQWRMLRHHAHISFLIADDESSSILPCRSCCRLERNTESLILGHSLKSPFSGP